MQLFEYSFDQIVKGEYPFEETVNYILTVPCVNRKEVLTYIFRSYRYREYLYITDIFPKMYEHDNRCFRRFTSREGFAVNMRRLSVTCVAIFFKHIINDNPKKAMVISGSYEDNEPTQGASRKLKLYQYFFTPLLEPLNLYSVNMFEENALILIRKDNPLSEMEIRQEYLNFKSNQK